MFEKAIRDIVAGFGLWRVWLYQAYHDISAKYKRTALGSLWIAGAWVSTSLSFAIVFGALFGNDIRTTLPFLMGGILAFNLIAFVINEATEIYVGNSGIISNHAYPFSFYTAHSLARSLLLFFHNAIVYLISLMLLSALKIPHWSIVFGLIIVVFNMFTWGTVVGMLSARFRDLRFLLPYLSSIIQFMTPIMYNPDQLKGMKHIFVDFNPFYPFVEMLRSPLMGHAMNPKLWPMAIGVTIVGAIVWVAVFPPLRKRIAFWV